ncbi:MAG: hypothetical protein J6C33_12720 [Lachnospiraceae bacterium]|nr:hypothetical protein [Lachnospiraceae bacterium]
MDNFMDKLAQRFNAQEMIKANSQAEAQELNKVREQIRAYDECLQEMRRINLKNIEAADQVRMLAGQVNDLAKQAINTIQESDRKDDEQLSAALSELKAVITKAQEQMSENEKLLQKQMTENGRLLQEQVEESGRLLREQTQESRTKLEEQTQEEQKLLQEARSQLEEFMHKESVKVYRNVQAVMLDEFKNQTAELSKKIEESRKTEKSRTALLIVTALSGVGSLVLLILQLLTQLGILAL